MRLRVLVPVRQWTRLCERRARVTDGGIQHSEQAAGGAWRLKERLKAGGKTGLRFSW